MKRPPIYTGVLTLERIRSQSRARAAISRILADADAGTESLMHALWRREAEARARAREAELQRVIDETLISGALPGEFTLVQVYQHGQPMKARIA